MRASFRRDLRRDLSYQQGGDPTGELGPQIAVQDRGETRLENRSQNGLDFGPETRFEPSSQVRAELRLQREFENGIHAMDEFRLQSRIQTAVQVGCDKGDENPGEMRIPDANPAAGATVPGRLRSFPSARIHSAFRVGLCQQDLRIKGL